MRCYHPIYREKNDIHGQLRIGSGNEKFVYENGDEAENNAGGKLEVEYFMRHTNLRYRYPMNVSSKKSARLFPVADTENHPMNGRISAVCGLVDRAQLGGIC